jgi:hypothetical protein
MAKRLPSGPFRRPEEMNVKLGDPRSVRFSSDTETVLEKEAAKAGIGFSTLVSQICDDYVAWLKKEREG